MTMGKPGSNHTHDVAAIFHRFGNQLKSPPASRGEGSSEEQGRPVLADCLGVPPNSSSDEAGIHGVCGPLFD